MSSNNCTACLDAPPAPLHPAASAEAQWPAVASLALGVFGLVTAEFLPASLLTAMAGDLHITDGAAGQAVTATALVGAVAAPSIPLLTKRLDRRHVMLALTLLLILSNVIAATANSLPVLLVVGLRLGCLNHALLSARAIAADGAHLAGWIASHVDPDMERVDDNIAMLRERLPAPCWGVLPHAEHPDPALLASRLRIPMLA